MPMAHQWYNHLDEENPMTLAYRTGRLVGRGDLQARTFRLEPSP